MIFGGKIAEYVINNQKITDKDQKEIIIYGAEVFMSTITGIFFTLCLGYILGLYIQVIFLLITSLLIRKTAGGAHSQYQSNCLIISVLSYNLIAFFARETYAYMQSFLLIIIFFSFAFGLIVTYYKAPVDSPQKPLSLAQKNQLKKLALLALVLIFGFQLTGYFLNLFNLINYSVCIVILWQYLMLTSAGHWVISLIDNTLNIIWKKGGE